MTTKLLLCMPLFEDPPGHTTTPHTGQSVLDPARDMPISFLVPALAASVGPSPRLGIYLDRSIRSPLFIMTQT